MSVVLKGLEADPADVLHDLMRWAVAMLRETVHLKVWESLVVAGVAGVAGHM